MLNAYYQCLIFQIIYRILHKISVITIFHSYKILKLDSLKILCLALGICTKLGKQTHIYYSVILYILLCHTLYTTLSYSIYTTLSYSLYTLSYSLYTTLSYSLYYSVILSLYYSAILYIYYSVILSIYYSVILSIYYSVILSIYYSVILSIVYMLLSIVYMLLCHTLLYNKMRIHLFAKFSANNDVDYMVCLSKSYRLRTRQLSDSSMST